MKIEILGGNELAMLPGEEKLFGVEEWAVSVPLEGRMYGVDLVNDGENLWLRKTLRGDVLTRFYQNSAGLLKVFERHFREHQTTLSFMGEFCIPTMFYVEKVDGVVSYRILQPWVRAAVQYKEAIMTHRKLVRRQLPELSGRLIFLAETAQLVEGIYPDLPDFDFFVTEDRTLAVFDTTGFWPERRDGKDRARIAYDLSHFLFTEAELEGGDMAERVDMLGGYFGG